MSRKHLKETMARRRTEATERQMAYDKLTPAQKLEALDEKLGKGVGAKKQRARLEKLVNG